jgi:hypothetical protein
VLLHNDQEVVLTEENSEEIIKDFIGHLFSSLSVPRKEKERIVGIISALRELSIKDTKKVRLSALSKKPFFTDLLVIGNVLKNVIVSEEVCAVFDAALKGMQQERSEYDADRPRRFINRSRRRR